MIEFKQIIEESMKQYAGAVLQSRALIDVRDGLKPSARQIFYSMKLHKLTSSNPYKKTANAVGMAMADFYIHGDSSCEGVIMRAGQPFAMRYPLVDVKGNAGTLIESGNWAAMRYTESRLSKISDVLFEDIDKDTISEWRDSYDNTKQFPGVLPSKGFYNIVNGTQGIGIGMASSVPQYNIRELNNALITLIDNPDCSFEDIYCAPDFATGAILYNENEVKQSMKEGTGFACKLRSVVEFDSKERCFIVTEIPYGVYTNTICGQLEEIINGENNPGIERFNDLTGKTPLIKIYLSKKANPDKILKYLYKETSLQYYYGINFTMLDKGRFPKVFTWKEMLQAHINHEREVYRRSFEFDLRKIENRIHIINGLLKAYDVIDEVIQTIKSSASTTEASIALQKLLSIDEIQAKAILDLKLAKLSKLDIKKLVNELEDLTKESKRIHEILENEELFKNELKNGWREVAKKFGDPRRTSILNIEDNAAEPTEIRKLQVSLTNFNTVFTAEASTLYTQKRGGVGNKIKFAKGEYIINSQALESSDEIIFFTNEGNCYHIPATELPVGESINIGGILEFGVNEKAKAFSALNLKNEKENVILLTKNGMIKKTLLSEYNISRKGSLKAISLNEGDEIVSGIFTNNFPIGILTFSGNYIIIDISELRSTGRITKGVKAIKLNDDDFVISAKVVPNNTKTIVSISGEGMIKQTPYSEFTIQGKNTKGTKIQKINDGDWMADFYPLTEEPDLLITSLNTAIRLRVNEIPVLSKSTLGNKALKLDAKNNVIGISS